MDIKFRKTIATVNDVETLEDILLYPGGIYKFIKYFTEDAIKTGKVSGKICELLYELYKISTRREYKIDYDYQKNYMNNIHINKILQILNNLEKTDIDNKEWATDLKLKINKCTVNESIINFKTRKMKLNVEINTFSDYKLKKIPIKEIHNYTHTVDEIYDKIINEWKIEHVGIDFDKTLIKEHTGNYSFDPEEYSKTKQHEYIVQLTKKLIENNVHVGIITHCDQQVANINKFCKLVFGTQIPIFANYHRSSKISTMINFVNMKKEYNDLEFYNSDRWGGYMCTNECGYEYDTTYKDEKGWFHFKYVDESENLSKSILIDDTKKHLDEIIAYNTNYKTNIKTMLVKMDAKVKKGEQTIVTFDVVEYP